MAEEFSQLPITLQKASAMLVHNRNCRTAFICGVIILMAAASSVSLAVCDLSKYQKIDGHEPTEVILKDQLPTQLKIQQLDRMGSIPYDTDENNNSQTIYYYIVKNINSSNVRTMINRFNFKPRNQARRSIILHSPVLNLTDSLSRSSNESGSSEESDGITPVGKPNGECRYPEYIVFTWVLCLVALATALKLYYLVKTALALGMVTIYTLLILKWYPNVFQQIKKIEPILYIKDSNRSLS